MCLCVTTNRRQERSILLEGRAGWLLTSSATRVSPCGPRPGRQLAWDRAGVRTLRSILPPFSSYSWPGPCHCSSLLWPFGQASRSIYTTHSCPQAVPTLLLVPPPPDFLVRPETGLLWAAGLCLSTFPAGLKGQNHT